MECDIICNDFRVTFQEDKIVCGILYTSFPLEEEQIKKSELKVTHRGPDSKSIKVIENQTFCHYLLHITGEKTPQPLHLKNSTLIYNGEIYNHDVFGDFPSDGFSILEAFDRDGINGIRSLDGEFSGIISKDNNVFIIRDVFGTKPIFMAKDVRGIAIASYKSQLTSLGFSNFIDIPNNSILKINLNDFRIDYYRNKTFDLNQKKTNFSDWNLAFYNSIKKRTENDRVKYFIGLSSGYDSGLISAVLNDLSKDYNSYSIVADENKTVLNERCKLSKNNQLIKLTKEEFLKEKKFLEKFCEPFKSPARKTRPSGYIMLNDKGSIGTGVICRKANKDGCKVYLSGQGSDEILSDYGFNGKPVPGFLQSTISGYFPEDLHSIFPWENFFKGTQEEFLAKDENVGGTYSIEARYPFLDFDLVQEFLWLSNSLKNKNYKSPIFNLLNELKYPMDPNGVNGKVGFRANKF